VSLAVLRTIEGEGLPANAAALGEKIRGAVAQWDCPLIAAVRGLGLMIGFVLNEDALAGNAAFAASGRTPSLFVVDALMAAGLLTVPAGADVVRWLPPLNATAEEVDEALDLMRRTLESLAAR